MTAFRASLILACIGVVISSLEYIAIASEFRPSGIFSWRVMGSRPEIAKLNSMFGDTTFLFGYKSILILHNARLLCCLVLPWLSNAQLVRLLLLSFVALTSLLLSFRTPVSGDGADQMSMIVFFGLAAFGLADNGLLRVVSLVFIAAQSVLSYVVAGVAKALSPKWRSGIALREIFNTRSYGQESIARSLNAAPSSVNVMLCWFVILAEINFALLFVLPAQWCLLILGLGVMFHVINAIVMGLNTFVWSFLATYPCVLFVNQLLVLPRH